MTALNIEGWLVQKINDLFSTVAALSSGKMGFPNYEAYSDITSVFTGGTRSYTATQSGYFSGKWHIVNGYVTVYINGVSYGTSVAVVNETNDYTFSCFLRAGDTISSNSGGSNASYAKMIFVPLS